MKQFEFEKDKTFVRLRLSKQVRNQFPWWKNPVFRWKARRWLKSLEARYQEEMLTKFRTDTMSQIAVDMALFGSSAVVQKEDGSFERVDFRNADKQ